MSSCSKIRMLSGALLITCALSACTMPRSIADLFGETRTVPDDAQVDFGNRRAPALNPGGNGDASNPTTERRVPIENQVAPQDNGAVVPPVTTPMTTDSITGFPALTNVPPNPVATPKQESTATLNSLTTERSQADVQRQAVLADPTATVLTSPQTGQLVDNAAALPPQPVPTSAPPLSPSPVALVPPAAAVQAAPAPAKTASSDTGFNTWLHNLFTSNKNASSQAAANAPASTGNAPRDLMAGSAASGSAASAQTVADNMPASAPASGAPMMTGRQVPAENVITDGNMPPAASPVAQDAMPPSVAMPTPVIPIREGNGQKGNSLSATMPPPQQMTSAPPPPPAVTTDPPPAMVPPAPSVQATAEPQPLPAAPAADVAPMEPLHLHPPGSMNAGNGAATDAMPMTSTDASGDTVHLVAPKAATASQTQYLPDSRYAARRARALPDDDDASLN